MLGNIISIKEKERNSAANKSISKIQLKKLLADYIKIYDGFTQEEKIRLNQLLFVEIVSYFKQDEDDGNIVIKIRGDGQLEKSWEQIKNASLLTEIKKVRTSDTLGSAGRT